MIPETLSILIPDESNKPLAYYAVACLKQAYPQVIVYVLESADDKGSDWGTFMRLSRYFKHVYKSKYRFEDSAYHEDVKGLIKKLNIDLIFPATELGFKYVSSHREDLSKLCKLIPLASHENLFTAFEKDRLGKFLMEQDISTPKTMSLEEFQAGANIEYPILLKPVQGFGGYGILKFDRPEDVKIPEKSRGPFIVQEFVKGYDIDCNVICKDGEIINYSIQKSLINTQNFGPMNRLKFVHNQKVLDTVKEACKALNWTGVNHVDLMYSEEKDQVWIIEMNPRFWGSFLGNMKLNMNYAAMALGLVYGVDIKKVEYEEQIYIKHTEAFKDLFKGKKNYPWSQTSVDFFLADLAPTIERLLRTKLKIQLPFKEKPIQ